MAAVTSVDRSHHGRLLVAGFDSSRSVGLARAPACGPDASVCTYSGHSSAIKCVRWIQGDGAVLSGGGKDGALMVVRTTRGGSITGGMKEGKISTGRQGV